RNHSRPRHSSRNRAATRSFDADCRLRKVIRLALPSGITGDAVQFNSKAQDGSLRLCDVTEDWSFRARVILSTFSREVFAGEPSDRTIRINQDDGPAESEEKTPNSAGDFYKVEEIATVRQLSTGNEALYETWHEHEGMDFIVYDTTKHNTTIASLREQQPAL